MTRSYISSVLVGVRDGENGTPAVIGDIHRLKDGNLHVMFRSVIKGYTKAPTPEGIAETIQLITL